jgi:hypothetical protein
MTRARIVSLGVASGFCLAVQALNALAADDKVFNGSMCTFTEPDHVGGQDRSYFKLWNSSGQTQAVSCPLKRDLGDHDIQEAYIIGSATIDEDTCKLWSVNDDFTYESWTHDDVESVAASYNKTTFSSGSSLLTPNDWASLQITCDIPDGAGVYNYYLRED